MNIKTHPYGQEMICANRNGYSSKVLVIKEGDSTPYIYHKTMDKTICVLQGVIQLKMEGRNKIINEGDDVHIRPKIMHMFTAIRGDATIIETGTELLDDEVVVNG